LTFDRRARTMHLSAGDARHLTPAGHRDTDGTNMPIEINHRVTGETIYTVGADTLGGACLRGANLRGANMSRANLTGADLSGANLRGANLSDADLRGADLSDADLSGADLRCANLRGANLIRANLIRANLRGANLIRANLIRANLGDADLIRANLIGADLSGADLRCANLRGAIIDESVCRMDFGGWSICIRSDKTTIGCYTHENSEWLQWGQEDVAYMDRRASDWWRVHGDAVKAAIRCVMEKANAK
jgi:hypothetical protein